MKKIFIIASALLAGLFIGCDDDSSDAAMLVIDPVQLEEMEGSFSALGESRTAAIKTNLNSVNVSSTQPWCKVQILDEDGFILRIAAMPNEGFDNRSALVVVYGKGIEDIVIPVNQLSSYPSLTVDKSEIEVIDGGLRFTLTVTSNVDYVFRRNGWIEDDGDNGIVVGTKTYHFKVPFIFPGTEREGRIDVKVTDLPNESLSKSIPVKQTQGDLNPELSTFSPASGSRGETITLSGVGFNGIPELIDVYFNGVKAEMLSIDNTKITVAVPKIPSATDQIETEIKVVAQQTTEHIYTGKFTYNKSWYLSTVTGNGSATFKGGTLADGQVKARYIDIDDDGNVYVTHRETGGDRHIVLINEEQNIVKSVLKIDTPNAANVASNGIIYVAQDGNGSTYYTIDRGNDYATATKSVNYSESGFTPPGSYYMYRLLHNEVDNHIYGFVGGTDSYIVKIDPATNKGALFYRVTAQNPYWYGATFSPDFSKVYASGNNATFGYGIYVMDMSNPDAGFTRLNSNGNMGAANTEALLKDGDLVDAGFGQCWGMDWGPDGRLYMSDFTNHIIRAVDLTTKKVETVLGKAGQAGTVDGNKDSARLNGPRGPVWNAEGTAMYISDFTGNTVRKWAYE